MGLSKLKAKLTEAVGKYKFVLLILCLGLLLILLPTGKEKTAEIGSIQTSYTSDEISQEALASILSKINGAGRVEVLLSAETSGQTEYQLDTDTTASASNRSTTVTVTDSQRNEKGLINRTHAPEYRGAVVVCDGADDPMVNYAIVNAVANITGLRSDQISVLKMK